MVEDDPLTAHLYKTSLEKAGFAVELASNGEVSLDQLRNLSPNAILLDIMLPKLSGIALLQRIRSDARFLHLPVFIFTNALIPAFIELAREYGAMDVFDKSKLTPKKFLEVIKLTLGHT